MKKVIKYIGHKLSRNTTTGTFASREFARKKAVRKVTNTALRKYHKTFKDLARYD